MTTTEEQETEETYIGRIQMGIMKKVIVPSSAKRATIDWIATIKGVGFSA